MVEAQLVRRALSAFRGTAPSDFSSEFGRGCVKTRYKHKIGGAETLPLLPIAALRASGEVGFSQGVLQPEFLHSLGQYFPFTPNNEYPHE
jgi:hypothetical protein